MNQERFSIGELATAAATTPRTIRFYTTEGLLPPPLTEGRNAIYSDAHRRRLRLIQRLKAAYLPLSAIKEQLAGLTDEQVDALLERSGPHRVENTGTAAHAPRPQALAPAPVTSNVDYVARILAVAGEALKTPARAEAAANPPRVLIVSPALRPDSDSGTVQGDAPGEEIGAAEHWDRFVLAPGVELHVLQPVAPERRAALSRMADLARSLLSEPRS